MKLCFPGMNWGHFWINHAFIKYCLLQNRFGFSNIYCSSYDAYSLWMLAISMVHLILLTSAQSRLSWRIKCSTWYSFQRITYPEFGIILFLIDVFFSLHLFDNVMFLTSHYILSIPGRHHISKASRLLMVASIIKVQVLNSYKKIRSIEAPSFLFRWSDLYCTVFF